MKRILMLLCSLLISLNVAADGHITVIKDLIEKGDYETAKKKIEVYEKLYPKEFTKDVVAFWMQKCDDGIAKKNRDEEIKVAKANAKRKEEEKRKQEAKLERERQQKEEARKQNKLVYISVETEIPGFEAHVRSCLNPVTTKIHNTSNKNDAYWMVVVETSIEETVEMTKYRAYACAEIKIVDLIENRIVYKETVTGDSELRIDKSFALNKAKDSLKKNVKQVLQDCVSKKIDSLRGDCDAINSGL